MQEQQQQQQQQKNNINNNYVQHTLLGVNKSSLTKYANIE